VDFFFPRPDSLDELLCSALEGFFFVAGLLDPFSKFVTFLAPSFVRIVFTAVPIGFSPFADDSPTIAPAIPPRVAITGPPTNPPTTAPAIPPATGFDTRGRFATFLFFLAMIDAF